MPDPIPPMTPVASSNLEAVGHDGASLYIRFKGKDGAPGPVWRYRGVAAAHAPAMIAAESPGQYFHRVVKAARVPGEKVE